MTARVYCAVLLCLSGCWSSTEAAPGQNFTANPANNEKCCSKGCGLQCRPPVTAKPGVCPSTNYEVICKRQGKVLCAADSECPKNQKCCITECDGRQCTAPVTVKPGECPKTNSEVIRCIKKGKVLCAGDSECPKNQKCCSTECGGRQCTAPVTVKPGVCPKTNGELIRCSEKGEELCADDSECPKKEKCCRTACDGRRCTAPVTVKPGVCPKTNGELIRCSEKDEELCADDSECPKNQKCCSTACDGRQCTAPVTENPGVCPITNDGTILCVMRDKVLCAGDNECPNNQKCCSTICNGLGCMAPVTANPGVCPSTRYEAEVCTWIRFVSCADDRDCVNNEKCCSNGCGLQCMATVTGNVLY